MPSNIERVRNPSAPDENPVHGAMPATKLRRRALTSDEEQEFEQYAKALVDSGNDLVREEETRIRESDIEFLSQRMTS